MDRAIRRNTGAPELKDKPDQSIRTAVRNIDKKMNKPKQQPIPPPEDKMYDFTGSRLYRFGVVSDTHLNSREQQLTHLNRMYDLFAAEGVSDVYHAGDITAGECMFTGQIYEIFNVGFDNQANYIIKKYPQRRGITTHFITGNHDLSYYKSRGVDIGEKIALKRPDLNYLGKWAAWVKHGREKYDTCRQGRGRRVKKSPYSGFVTKNFKASGHSWAKSV